MQCEPSYIDGLIADGYYVITGWLANDGDPSPSWVAPTGKTMGSGLRSGNSPTRSGSLSQSSRRGASLVVRGRSLRDLGTHEMGRYFRCPGAALVSAFSTSVRPAFGLAEPKNGFNVSRANYPLVTRPAPQDHVTHSHSDISRTGGRLAELSGKAGGVNQQHLPVLPYDY